MRFKGKALLVTGGGSGIGARVAETYAAEGGKVAILDRNIEAAEVLAARLPDALSIACDVSDEASVQAAVDASLGRFGAIDGVLNAAGHVINKSIEDTSLADWSRMLTVHATGTFLVCRAVAPVMKAGGGGAIVNMGSVAGLAGAPNLCAYSAAKGAILALSRQLAVELAGAAIRVNVVAPGPIETPMSIELAISRGGGDRQKGTQPVIDTTPLGRIGTPAEAAAGILFLLSDDASYYTGSCLTPDGGRLAT